MKKRKNNQKSSRQYLLVFSLLIIGSICIFTIVFHTTNRSFFEQFESVDDLESFLFTQLEYQSSSVEESRKFMLSHLVGGESCTNAVQNDISFTCSVWATSPSLVGRGKFYIEFIYTDNTLTSINVTNHWDGI
jgi:hypothetical protein